MADEEDDDDWIPPNLPLDDPGQLIEDVPLPYIPDVDPEPEL